VPIILRKRTKGGGWKCGSGDIEFKISQRTQTWKILKKESIKQGKGIEPKGERSKLRREFKGHLEN